MLTVLLTAAALSLEGGQVSVIARAPAPAEARPAGTAPGPEGDVRRVCRMERATGSNMQQRVCRNIPRAGVQSQQTREFMDNLQRMGLPDEGDHAAHGPQPR